MHNLNKNDVYIWDIIPIGNESFYRLTFRYNGKLHCSLFKTDSDVREFIDRYYLDWMANRAEFDTPPAEAVD